MNILQNFETEQYYISSVPLQLDRCILKKNTLLKQYYYINYVSRKKDWWNIEYFSPIAMVKNIQATLT